MKPGIIAVKVGLIAAWGEEGGYLETRYTAHPEYIGKRWPRAELKKKNSAERHQFFFQLVTVSKPEMATWDCPAIVYDYVLATEPKNVFFHTAARPVASGEAIGG